MSARERFVVLGLAHARSPWFGEVARWATSAALPIEFVKCLSVEELRARLEGGRAFSAVVVDAGLPGVDRDLVDTAAGAGCAVVVVDDHRARRDWAALGATVVLPATFGRVELLDALTAHAAPVARGEAVAFTATLDAAHGPVPGALVAVTGTPGSGTSVLAMALAQGLAAKDARESVLLADLALDADQAVLHDAGDVVPGLLELVDAHRGGVPSAATVHGLMFSVDDLGYSLLLGLRRRRDWAALRLRAVEASLRTLRRTFHVVVADVDADVEGEAQTGSADVEDRNVLARTATAAADAVVVVGLPGPKGVHALVRTLDGLLEHGVAPGRIVPVLNKAPRSPRAKAEHVRALAELAANLPGGSGLPAPMFVPERRHVDDLLLDGHRLPAQLATPLARVVSGLLDRMPAEPVPVATGAPVPVAPGSLGSWAAEEF